MKIVGCDLHTRCQKIAMLDQEMGELMERRFGTHAAKGGRVAQVSRCSRPGE